LKEQHKDHLEARALEERKKLGVQIHRLENEIVSLKEAIKREQREAEASIQVILESGASQVTNLQEAHDLKAAFLRGQSTAEKQIASLREELLSMQKDKIRVEEETQESIRTIIESGAAQIFALQEELNKSQAAVEAVTRLARGLLRP
jgi:predicted DNA-binding ArsR family transcriptional regulator